MSTASGVCAMKRGLALDGARLGDEQRVDLDAVGLERGGEVEAGRQRLQLRERQLVVGLVGVATVDPGPVRLGNAGLESHDRLRARSAVRLAGQGEHLGEIGDILGSRLGHLRAVGEIIIAVGQTETAPG